MATFPEDTRSLHETMDFLGLRAHATTAGLLQLCSELVRAGVIDLEAIDRIKNAIHCEIMHSQTRTHNTADFAQTLRERLNAIFPHGGEGERTSRAGSVHEMQSALETHT